MDEDELAPDAHEPGDPVDPEIADLVTTDLNDLVPDNVDKEEVDDA